MKGQRTVNYAAGSKFVGNGTLGGLVIRETAGGVGVVRVWDNTSAASGNLLAVITVAASGSGALLHLDARFELGVFCETVSGTIEGLLLLE